ncbi:hypothetical protein Droror1_Dr00020059 [Drosera rotundifolia]
MEISSPHMDVELYNVATMDTDDVDAFIGVLERMAAKKGYAFENIFQRVSPTGNALLLQNSTRNFVFILHESPFHGPLHYKRNCCNKNVSPQDALVRMRS